MHDDTALWRKMDRAQAAAWWADEPKSVKQRVENIFFDTPLPKKLLTLRMIRAEISAACDAGRLNRGLLSWIDGECKRLAR